jgi:hypothetical protein
MKKLLIAALLLLCLPSAHAQIMGMTSHHVFAPPQAIYANNGCVANANGISQLTCVVSNVTSGQTIFLNTEQSNATISSVTDSNTGTIATVVGPLIWSGGSAHDTTYVVTGVGAGTHSLTVKFSGTASYVELIGLVVSNANAINPVDSAASSQLSQYIYTCAPITPTSSAELVISFIHGSGNIYLPSANTPRMTIAQSESADNTSSYGNAISPVSQSIIWSSTVASPATSCTSIAVKH